MFKHKPTESRRQVQRRFLPGTFIVSEDGRMAIVIGWSPTAPAYSKRTGDMIQSQGWQVHIIKGDCRLTTVDWSWIRNHWVPLEEWELLQ